MSMVTSTVPSPGGSATWIVPDSAVNRPRTLVSMKWRPMNATSVWPGSICHRPAPGSSACSAGSPASELVRYSVSVMTSSLIICVRTHIIYVRTHTCKR
jgi:hypothetical protein